jgi:hypothetical protein
MSDLKWNASFSTQQTVDTEFEKFQLVNQHSQQIDSWQILVTVTAIGVFFRKGLRK